MRTISVDQARMELPQVFDEVEAGGEIIIARGGKPVAHLVPITDSPRPRRPKVGELRGAPFQIPDKLSLRSQTRNSRSGGCETPARYVCFLMAGHRTVEAVSSRHDRVGR